MKKYFLATFITFLSLNAHGLDFGKQGNTFFIKEEGFIAMIQRKLKSVDLAEHEQKMRDHARRVVEEPKAVAGITKATKTTSHSFDPSYILDQDVKLPYGKLLYAAGTSINPLDHMNWDGKLLFIDGRDKEQIDWVVGNYFQAEGNHKIVLVAGKPFELEREVQNPVYFDQAGELTKRFNIAHVPAIVEQEGKYLKVTEVDIGRRYES